VTQATAEQEFPPGTLVRARGRDWVVQPSQDPLVLNLRPLAGHPRESAGVLLGIEPVASAGFAPPTLADLGDSAGVGLMRSALRIGFRSGAGPFRSFASLAVEPRPYQLVPLLMALRMETVRLLIADDVGIGKTVEAGLIAAELLAQGDATRLAVLCSPHLADQWQQELRHKFGIHAEVVLSSTAAKLTRDVPFGQTLFTHYRHLIISTELVKSGERRTAFLRDCPDLVIVDEAHTCAADLTAPGRRSGAHLRHELIKDLSEDPARHLLLVTATPHSGKQGAFESLLGLLDPQLPDLIDSRREADRRRLARHYIQRRRAHLRAYLETTPFPERAPTAEHTYQFSRSYRDLFDRVRAFARHTAEQAPDPLAKRVAWWSALTMLQAFASSPHALAATLTSRAATTDAATPEQADAVAASLLLDQDSDAVLETADAVPGANPFDMEPNTPDAPGTVAAIPVDGEPADVLRSLAHAARRLRPAEDRKLQALLTQVRALLADGHDPIVFCRFIPTAAYLAAHLTTALDGAQVTVTSVTGLMPPSAREAAIASLSAADTPRRILVATDCISEGVNLQEHFDTVIHYDLAWNPTRHEQREGRVDRYGQARPTAHVHVIYGTDNKVDLLVLDVLLRKHEAIRRSTGVSIPVPGDGASLLGLLAEHLLLDDTGPVGPHAEQLALEFDPEDEARLRGDAGSLHARWEKLAEEEATRSRFAHITINPEEVAAELAAVRAALGRPEEVADFTRRALRALGAEVEPAAEGFAAHTHALPAAVHEALPRAHREPLAFHTDLPVPPRECALTRTDPVVAALARYVLDGALEPELADHRRPARRCGAIATGRVQRRTVLLLARFRYALTLPQAPAPLIVEDARVLAYQSTSQGPVWLNDADAIDLVDVQPEANIPAAQIERTLLRALEGELPDLWDTLAERAQSSATELEETHRSIRREAEARIRGLRVEAFARPDILGVYVYLPLTGQGGAA
jgi:superfamily II DNA or RNA helicase